ncbi:hypothetical protein CPC08DRAFT_300350 [Agrocybe pediades]|nr:hypothetical protein CPC08DRAFT_300350 [Agrocybe pediades]
MNLLLPFKFSYLFLTPNRVRLPGEIAPQTSATDKDASGRTTTTRQSVHFRSLRELSIGIKPSRSIRSRVRSNSVPTDVPCTCFLLVICISMYSYVPNALPMLYIRKGNHHQLYW